MLATNVGKMWIFCYCGELVTTKCNEIPQAMYGSKWYNLWRSRDLKTIQFMLASSQKISGFSIGGFGFLSYNTFTKVRIEWFAFLQMNHMLFLFAFFS